MCDLYLGWGEYPVHLKTTVKLNGDFLVFSTLVGGSIVHQTVSRYFQRGIPRALAVGGCQGIIRT